MNSKKWWVNKKVNVHRSTHITRHPIKSSPLLCLLLVLSVAAVYHSVLTASFISFDDSVYVYDNPVIKGGFSLDNLTRIFRFKQESGAYWHPVTSLSHMLDVKMYGLRPGFHHLTNLIIHTASVLLLFMFFQRSTGRSGPSFFIALLFAVHPLNVETVAWVSERKNLLSVFFFILGLHAWKYHAAKRSGLSYLLLWIVFFSGMMSKPLMMTFPFALLLVHHFPLAAYDYSQKKTGAFVIENIREVKPVIQMIVVMLIFFAVGFSMSETAGQTVPLTHVPLSLRLSNMAASYLIYLKMLILPVNLTVFHPYPASVGIMTAGLSVIVLACVSAFAFMMFRRLPWFFTGWFWYLGNFVTASGLVQKGYWPAYADRFTYLPMIGMFIVLVWSISEIMDRLASRAASAVVGIVPAVCLAVLAHTQAGHWTSAETLFRHAVKVNPFDVLSLTNLALALGEQNRIDEAIEVSHKVLAIEPRYAEALNNLGTLYAKKGDYARGLECFERSLEAYPGFTQARINAEKARRFLEPEDKTGQPAESSAQTPPEGGSQNALDLAGEEALRLIAEKKFAQAEKLYLSMLVSHPEAKVSILYNLACLYAIMEQPDRAMAYLVNSVREGFSSWEHLERDKDLEILKDREDFKALIDLGRKVGKP